jgi:hypothetical protein
LRWRGSLLFETSMPSYAPFNHYCEDIGRASAIVAFVSVASLILVATAIDILR